MRKLKVLIGGAEPVFCDLRKAAREFWGFDVMEVADGKQACAALRTQHVDICVLDWDLPKMTGLAACYWIRSVELKNQPYIVLLTEKGRPEQTQAAYAAGADDFLAKPFNAENLHFLVSTFAHKISQLDLTSRELTHIDPVELYRRDLPAPKIFSRL
jgi:DNA-binding response OmpR family regulator